MSKELNQKVYNRNTKNTWRVSIPKPSVVPVDKTLSWLLNVHKQGCGSMEPLVTLGNQPASDT
jgi:hypothetical protein